jgi:hypothetical protein
MKTSTSISNWLRKSILVSIAWLALSIPTHAVIVVVDTFDQTPFTISLAPPHFHGNTHPVNLPIGEARTDSLNPRTPAPGTIMTATLDDTAGTLSLSASGSSLSPRVPLDLRQTYRGGGPYSILGFSGFVFEFSDVQGVGALIVNLGSELAIYPPEAHRIPIIGPGALFYPIDQVNFGPRGSLDSFPALHFVYEAHSPEFSFTLDEIRLVPEPGAVPFVAIGVGMLLLHRRRTRGRPAA